MKYIGGKNEEGEKGELLKVVGSSYPFGFR